MHANKTSLTFPEAGVGASCAVPVPRDCAAFKRHVEVKISSTVANTFCNIIPLLSFTCFHEVQFWNLI